MWIEKHNKGENGTLQCSAGPERLLQHVAPFLTIRHLEFTHPLRLAEQCLGECTRFEPTWLGHVVVWAIELVELSEKLTSQPCVCVV